MMADKQTTSVRPYMRFAVKSLQTTLVMLVVLASLPELCAVAAQVRVGKVIDAVGGVSVRRVEEPNAEKLDNGSYVYVGDTIMTSRSGRVKFLMKDESVLTLGRSATLVVRSYDVNNSTDERNTTLYLVTGKLRALVNKIFGSRDSNFKVQTPTAVAEVRGTHFIVVSNLNDETVIYCLSGSVISSNRDKKIQDKVVLKQGECSSVLENLEPTKIMDCLSGTALYDLLNDTTLGNLDMTVDNVMVDSSEIEDINSFTPQDVIDLVPSGGRSAGQGYGQTSTPYQNDRKRDKEYMSPFGDIPSGGTGGGGRDLSPNGR